MAGMLLLATHLGEKATVGDILTSVLYINFVDKYTPTPKSQRLFWVSVGFKPRVVDPQTN